MKRDEEQEVEMALGSTSEVWVHSDAATGGDKDRKELPNSTMIGSMDSDFYS